MSTWTAGARSIASLAANGWFSFRVPRAVSGIVAGFNDADLSTSPVEIQFGFQITSGTWRVYERGTARTSYTAYASDTTKFYVMRHGGRIYYMVGTTPSTHPDLPFETPAPVVYVSAEPAPIVPLFLDASFLQPGDAVFDMESHVLVASSAVGVVHGSFLPLIGQAVAAEYASVFGAFEPMQGEAGAASIYRVTGSFEPMWGYAAEGDFAFVHGSFQPMQGLAGVFDDIALTGVAGEFEPLIGLASGDEWFEPVVYGFFSEMTGLASQGEYAFAEGSFLPLMGFSAGVSAIDTPFFSIQLPAMTWDDTVGADFNDVEDTIIFSDEKEAFSLNRLESVVSFSDQMQEVRNHYVEDSISFTDAQAQAGSIYVEDTVEMSDEVAHAGAQVVADTITLTDAREGTTTSSTELQDALTFSDEAKSVSVQFVEVSFSLSDEQSHASGQTVESEITLSDEISDSTVSHGVVLTSEITTTISLSDDVEAQSVSQHDIVEHITFTDTHFHKEPGAIAWVMNTETAAPSWYSNWQFVDMVQVGNKVLAVGPEGLVELGAGTDAGEDIDAVLGYGFSELGGYDRRGNPSPDPQKKRVDSFWFGYTSDDVLEVSVETLGQPVYTYSMEARNAEQARNNRIRPGKGLNARYWRVVITNVGGCEFDVDSIGADVVPTSRRL